MNFLEEDHFAFPLPCSHYINLMEINSNEGSLMETCWNIWGNYFKFGSFNGRIHPKSIDVVSDFLL